MAVKIRKYRNELGYSEDFYRVYDFLIRINKDRVITPHYLWARWVWQFSPYMNMDHLSRIGLAEVDGVIIGLITYECELGEVYFCLDPQYEGIFSDLIDYAIKELSLEGKIRVSIPDTDSLFQRTVLMKGFVPSTEKSSVAMIEMNHLAYSLPEGYRIIGFDDASFDVDRYYNAIWRGFNNQRQRNQKELDSMHRREGFDAPNFDPHLRTLVVAPNGDYAAHCGMWHLPHCDYAYVEPVFTLPEYRRMGLGKAAVIEAVERCKQRGAQKAYVLSSQQFYYSIGFYPVQNETWWRYQSPA